jgi:hypothetical protein
MILTIGGEALGVLGIVGGGVGVGLWFDTATRRFGPYVYGLAGGGLGAFGGGVIELGVYRDMEAFAGPGLEVGAASGSLMSIGANASYTSTGNPTTQRRPVGVALDVGVGGGVGTWALGSRTYARGSRST